MLSAQVLGWILLVAVLSAAGEGGKSKAGGGRSKSTPSVPKVRTLHGTCRGTTAPSYSGRTYYAYKGIPYAQPPVGELRFQGPRKLALGTGPIDATMDGPMCMQKNYLLPTPALSGQEDCLYLNVYTPRVGASVRLPVMVYIHGGGWFTGTGASYINGPDYLMDKNVVLVTFNYRLGALGFLSTGDAHAPGNYGMKDQVAALYWVQRNIAGFGGDPNLVTIFGQSAGAASVHYHMLSPLSAGLFHRAISQSGTALSAWAWPGDTFSVAQQQAKFVDCPHDDSAEMIRCLRQVDAANLTDSGDKFKFWSIDPLTVYVPVLEPPGVAPEVAFMTEDPMRVIRSGRFSKVPWIMGVVAQEGIVRGLPIVSDAGLLADLNARWWTLGPQLLEVEKSVGTALVDEMWANVTEFYLNNELPLQADNALGFINLYSDRSFVHGIHKAALLHASTGHMNIYMYKLDYVGAHSYANLFAQNPTKYGTSHCDDLIYLFRSPILFPDWPRDHPDLKVKDSLITLWTNFAKHGNPTPNVVPNPRKLSCDLDASKNCDLSVLNWSPMPVPGSQSPLQTTYLSIQFNNNTNNNNNTNSNNYANSSNRPTLDFGMERDLFKSRMEFWDCAPLVENSLQGLPTFHTVQV